MKNTRGYTRSGACEKLNDCCFSLLDGFLLKQFAEVGRDIDHRDQLACLNLHAGVVEVVDFSNSCYADEG